MKHLSIGFLVSLCIHVLLLCFVIARSRSMKQTAEWIPVSLYPELPASSSFDFPPGSGYSSSSPGGQNSGLSPTENNANMIPSPGTPGTQFSEGEFPDGIIYTKESPFVPVAETTRSILFTWRKPGTTFKEALTGKPAQKTDLREKVHSWLSALGTSGGGNRPDPAADYIKNQRGNSPVLALNRARPAESKKTEQHPLQFDFIPNPVQLNAMTSLYNMKQGTQNDLYSAMAPTLVVTAEGLDANLEYLVRKGFLKRKKISPEQLFTFFGVAAVEMSPKNKRNPEYLYTPAVDRSILITFFQAQIFELNENLHRAPADSLIIRNKIENLNDMIQVLIRT